MPQTQFKGKRRVSSKQNHHADIIFFSVPNSISSFTRKKKYNDSTKFYLVTRNSKMLKYFIILSLATG